MFYLLWRSLSDDNAGSGGVWALIWGSVVALIQFFLGNLVDPGGFGWSRWISACIDIVALPAVLPLLVYVVCVALKFFSGTKDFTNFALLWLIPTGAIRAVGWSAQRDPILLALAPLLWTAIAVGVPFFIRRVINMPKIGALIIYILGILVLPFLSATVYWAFFSQKYPLGALLLAFALAPLIISVTTALIRENKA
jgi:hypothetical protein